MTVIGTFQMEGVPVLVGDVMLSRPGGARLHKLSDIPTVSSSSRVGSEMKLDMCGMVQKIYIPHPHVAVAWSGSAFIASIFCLALKRALFDQRSFSERIKNFLDSYPKEDLKLVEIIVVWKGRDGFEYFLSGENVHFELNDSYTNVAIGGSGGSHFFKFIDRHSSGRYAIYVSEVRKGAQESMVEIATAIGLAYWASAIVEQHFGFVGLDEDWGSAFEVVVFDGVRFRKIDRVNLNSLMFRLRSGAREIANHKLDIWQGYVKQTMLVKDTPGTLFIIPSLEQLRNGAGGMFGKNIKKVAWSVLCVLDECGNGFSLSLGVRRMRGALAGWEVSDDSFSFSESVVQTIRENGLAIFI